MSFTFNLHDDYPFIGFPEWDEASKSFIKPTYPTLLHFIESEKFRGVSESYRKFLIDQDVNDVVLEASYISTDNKREDWECLKQRVITAGLWFQFMQNKELINQTIESDQAINENPVIQSFADSLRRLHLKEEVAIRLAFIDLTVTPLNPKNLAPVFSAKLPHEILLFEGQPSFECLLKVCIDNYIPVKIAPFTYAEVSENFVKLKGYLSHLAFIGNFNSASNEHADLINDFKVQDGKKVICVD